ncbi:hypothetical protein JW906_04185 [bacterium]|nr:hypothetical protein [bacterium]
MRPGFEKTGADWDQVAVLVKNGIRLQFRSGRRMPGPRRLSGFHWTIILYCIMGFSMAMSLVFRTTPFLYSLLTLAYAMVMIGFSTAADFALTILYPDEEEIILHRPVSSRTYWLYKTGVLGFSILALTAALCLPAALLGLMLKGAPLFYPAVYFPAALLAGTAAALAIIALYSMFFSWLRRERFQNALSWFQILLTFSLILFFQMLPDAGWPQAEKSAWYLFLPPAWFAGLIQVLCGGADRLDGMLAAAAVLSLVPLCAVTAGKFSSEYLSRLSSPDASGISGRARKGGTSAAAAGRVRLFSSDPESGAGYLLAAGMLKKDRMARASAHVLFGVPLIFLLLDVLRNRIGDPFAPGSSGAQDFGIRMHLFFSCFAVFYVLKGLAYSRDWQAAWIFSAAPITGAGRFTRGVKTAVLLKVIVPYYFLCALLLCTRMHWMSGLRHALTLLALGCVGFSLSSFLIKDFPFSRKQMPGDRSLRIRYLLCSIPFYALCAGFQKWTYGDDTAWLIGMGMLIVVFAASEGWSLRHSPVCLKADEG